jgi:hypothetical protein
MSTVDAAPGASGGRGAAELVLCWLCREVELMLLREWWEGGSLL